MGMDVFGVAPSSQTGEYFRRNVWNWTSLWAYCEDNHSDITDDVQYAYSNDGDGLDTEKAKQLAERLFLDIDSGIAAQYVISRDLILSAAPTKPCLMCEGTGVRTDEVGIDLGMPQMELNSDQVVRLGRSHGWCNCCRGEGITHSWEKNAKLTVQDIAEFAAFLESCGGFSIQ